MVLGREAEEWVLRPTVVISTLGSLMLCPLTQVLHSQAYSHMLTNVIPGCLCAQLCA
jgi:hypothetical protein